MPKSISIIMALCLLFSFQKSTAQRFPFYNLKVENGLVQSQATSLAQDKFGNLWIGTLGGLSRYDGKKIKNYTLSDGLISNNIVDIDFIADGQLLISTGKSVQRFDGKKFTEIFLPSKKSAALTNQFCQVNKGSIFCLQNGILCTLNLANNSINPTDLKESLSTIFYSEQGLLAADTKGNLLQLDENSGGIKSTVARSKDSNLIILKIFEDRKRNRWLLCNKGLYQQNGARIEAYILNHNQAIAVSLLSAAEDNNGQIWFGSAVGAFRLRDSSISYFNQKNGLSNNLIYDALTDKEGNIWLSTDGEGVFRYSGGPFISLDENFGLPNKQVTGITGSEDGSIFFSSYQGKISTYKLGGKISVIDAPEVQQDIITAICYQKGKGLWIGTRSSGLYLQSKNGQIIKQVLPQTKGNNNNITTLFCDNQNRLLVGLSSDMLSLSGDKISFCNLDQVSPVCITNIGLDSSLIATNNGFYLFSKGNTSKWKPKAIFDSVLAQCMTMSGRVLYIGTTERGIISFDLSNQNLKNYNTKNGLSSDFIYNILKDEFGSIWAGTGMGICKLSTSEKGAIHITIYGKANGVLGLESNSNAAFADSLGHIWFGTTEGVSCFFPSAKPTKAKAISVVLESVKLFGGKNIDTTLYLRNTGWYGIPEALKLPYRLNNISFAFQAITLSPTEKIVYRYKLEGADATWSEWSEENTINFSALEPGNYTLHIMCKINNEIQSQAALKYSFVIATPFHKSIWFVVCIIALAILSGVLLQHFRNKRKLNRSMREDALRKEEQSRIRERTAEDFHDEVGNKLTRINVLTSVLQSKIEKPNPDAERIIQQIQDNSLQLYAGTRDILWSLQPSNDNLYEILHHVSDLARELFSETEINFSFSGNEERFKEYKMPLDKSRNFIMLWKEALNNCMKYAQAKNVLLQVQVNDSIQIRLVDDGKGFIKENVSIGNGLKNMNGRAQRLGAQLEILSNPNKGTQIILTL